MRPCVTAFVFLPARVALAFPRDSRVLLTDSTNAPGSVNPGVRTFFANPEIHFSLCVKDSFDKLCSAYILTRKNSTNFAMELF